MWLVERRKQAGLSQEKLAEVLGVARSSVSHWEIGKFNPPLDDPKFRRDLANALQMTIPELLTLAGYEIERMYSRQAMRAADLVEQLPTDQRDLALNILEQLIKANFATQVG